MKVEIKITDDADNVQQYVIDDSLLTDQEIEEFSKSVYGEEGEILERITNSFIVGAKWARDVLKYTVEADNLQDALDIAVKQFMSEPDDNYISDSVNVDDIIHEYGEKFNLENSIDKTFV